MNLHCTVLIPAFNTSQYLPQCLSSVLAQNYKNFDILVVNDGSTDCTPAVVQDYMRRGPVSLLNLKKNQGVTYATKEGIKAAQGSVITIVDSDDLIFQNSLKVGIQPFKDPEVGFVWTEFQKSRGGMGWSHPLPEGRSLWAAMMYDGWWKASHQRFFRKSTYESGIPLNTNFDRSSDYQLVLLLASTGCKYKHIEETTYWYRLHRPGSLTSQGSSKQRKAVSEIKAWLKSEMRMRGMNEPE